VIIVDALQTTPSSTSAVQSLHGRRPFVSAARLTLIGIEIVAAAAALYGGLGMVAGNWIRMDDAWLDGTPFHSWLLPGLFLLAVVAVPVATAAILELRRSRRAWIGSLVAGFVLVGWIVAQLLIMQRYFVLQPVVQILGMVILVSAIVVHLRPTGPTDRSA
jgi:hypothetical protein